MPDVCAYELELPEGVARPGDTFAGKYRIDRVLGVGGMGVVLGATHLHLEERVAIKVLLPEHAQKADTVSRFLREGRAAVKIRSEHVARVLDVGMNDGSPYLVMEYLDGVDLSVLLEQGGPLPIALAVDYVLQACEALAEAHAGGIVHRDLKPSNLFVTNTHDGAPCVKVLDFGISKAMGPGEAGRADFAMTKTNMVMGSPVYMAPEQMRSTRRVDARADIWALGTMVHELLTGRPPFVAQTMPELCAMIVQDPTPLLRASRPDAPAGLEAVIAKCLEKDPVNRYACVADLAVAVAPFGTGGARSSVERILRVTPASRPRWDSVSQQSGLSASQPNVSGALQDPSQSQPVLLEKPSPSYRFTPANGREISLPAQLTRTSKAWGSSEPPAPHRRVGWIAAAASLPAIAVAIFFAVKAGHATGSETVLATEPPPPQAALPQPAVAPSVATQTPEAVPPMVSMTASASPTIAAPPVTAAHTPPRVLPTAPATHPPHPITTPSAVPRPPSTGLATDRHG